MLDRIRQLALLYRPVEGTAPEKSVNEAPALPATPSSGQEPTFVETQDAVLNIIRTIYDPEIPVNIYDLGLIYNIEVRNGGVVKVTMTLTSPSCPVAGTLPGEVADKIRGVHGVSEVDVELTFDPPWSQDLMSEEAKLELGFL
ncbi:MAG: SUF system Fe-S cluster assembly protein [Sphingobacteriia bacterium]|nr:SUF system Fe-S cluster assembly protein [Bacteroidota bacterium]MCF8194033.1 SUF system Fe-S cluster assembly protein [Bacteroidia bacterium]NBW42671.1 SUF system Fe-S cluster assembly protein [Sphingobacteriia bacterium]